MITHNKNKLEIDNEHAFNHNKLYLHNLLKKLRINENLLTQPDPIPIPIHKRNKKSINPTWNLPQEKQLEPAAPEPEMQ